MGEAAEPGLGDAQAILSAYVGVVGVLGLACLLYVLARLQQRRSLITFRLRPWSIGWTDFLILVFLLLSWTVASSASFTASCHRSKASRRAENTKCGRQRSRGC
jgi:hypothetical protein